MGKTSLLEAILEQSQWGGKAESLSGSCVAHQVIDMAHPELHAPEGLIRQIMEVLGKWFFDSAQSLLPALEQARLSGDIAAVKHSEQALQAATDRPASSATRGRLEDLWPSIRSSLVQSLEARMRDRI